MTEWIQAHLPALLLVAIGIVVTMALTVWVFSRRRNLYRRGPKKGTAAHPGKVRRDNPPN